MQLTTKMLLDFWKKFEGQTVTIPPCPISTPEAPEVPKQKTLTGYNYGKSDAPGKAGQYYLIIEGSWTISSVLVGDTPYSYERIYGKGELYYGPPANGKITVTLNNGEVFVSEDEVGSSEPVQASTKIPLHYHKRTNGNRPTYYTYQGSLKVGQVVSFRIGPINKTVVIKTRHNGSIGWDNGDLVIKNSDVNGRGVAVLTPANSRTDYPQSECWIML